MTEKPRLNVLAGPNGSGKSTLYERMSHRFKGPFINADQLAIKTGSKASGGREAIKERNRLFAEKHGFTVETTLSGAGPLKMMEKALELGYDVRLYFVSLNDPEKNMQRVKDRVVKGGHDVPVEDIERRYQRSLENLPKALKIAHRSYVYDNSSTRHRLVFIKTRYQVKLNKNWRGVLPRWLPDQIQKALGRLDTGLSR